MVSDSDSSSEDPAQLTKWDPVFEKGKHFSMLIISSRNSGKSYLCRYLLQYRLVDKFDLFVIFVNNNEELEKYTEIVPTELAFTDYKPELINDIRRKNEERIVQGKKMLNVLVLLDDTVGNKIKSDDTLLQSYTNGRHAGITTIFISQSYALANTAWRNNSDVVILLKQNSGGARKAIVENFLDGSLYIDDDKNEKKIYKKIVYKYMSKVGDCLIIDYRDASSDNLHWFRAP